MQKLQHFNSPIKTCGYIVQENSITKALLTCIAYGYIHIADLIAAINIKARGHRVLSGENLDFFACGGYKMLRSAKFSSVFPLKQEPAKTIRESLSLFWCLESSSFMARRMSIKVYLNYKQIKTR